MNHDQVMLLIDADNVSLDVMEQAVPWVARHYGGPHVRRAYCTAESAVKHQQAFKKLGIRPMVNLAAGKNSTDIALAVDAIDLATAERPEVVVIASSDSDFAPLVARLREKGCRVVGIGQQGKTGEETVSVYDDYEVMAHRKGDAEAAPRPARTARAPRSGRAAAAGVATPPAAPAPVPEDAPEAAPPRARGGARKSAAPGKAPRKTARKTAAKAAPARPARPAGAQALVDALPELAGGKPMPLNGAAVLLREAGLLSRSGSSTRLFGKFPDVFELSPAQQPNYVTLRA
jgi:hypothetical protein